MRFAALAGRAEEGSTIRRLALFLLLSAVLVVTGLLTRPARGGAAAINGELVARPLAGHSGDTIFLSGGFLDPNTKYFVLMICPNWHDPNWARDGNIEWATRIGKHGKVQYRPAVTDANGVFMKFELPALTLHGIQSSVCTIYVSNGVNPYGPEVPATYTILAQGDHPKKNSCLIHMCPQLGVAFKHVRAGGSEMVNIDEGWPGATATVWVKFANGAAPTQKGTVTLNWEGSGRVKINVPLAAAHLSCSQVKISARLQLGTNTAKKGSGPCFSVAR